MNFIEDSIVNMEVLSSAELASSLTEAVHVLSVTCIFTEAVFFHCGTFDVPCILANVISGVQVSAETASLGACALHVVPESLLRTEAYLLPVSAVVSFSPPEGIIIASTLVATELAVTVHPLIRCRGRVIFAVALLGPCRTFSSHIHTRRCTSFSVDSSEAIFARAVVAVWCVRTYCVHIAIVGTSVEAFVGQGNFLSTCLSIAFKSIVTGAVVPTRCIRALSIDVTIIEAREKALIHIAVGHSVTFVSLPAFARVTVLLIVTIGKHVTVVQGRTQTFVHVALGTSDSITLITTFTGTGI